MRDLWRSLVCAVFGECWKADEALRRVEKLEGRVGRLERGVRRERSVTRWQPADTFWVWRQP